MRLFLPEYHRYDRLKPHQSDNPYGTCRKAPDSWRNLLQSVDAGYTGPPRPYPRFSPIFHIPVSILTGLPILLV